MNTLYNFDAAPDRRGTNSTKWDGPASADGGPLLPMWVADTDFAVLPEIVEALQKRCCHPVFGYTIPPDAFYQSFMAWNESRHELHLEKDWLLRSSGVISSMKAALLAFTEKGDSVVVQTPVYPPFMGAVNITGRALVQSPLCPTATGYEMDFDHLEACFAAGAKMMLLCSPHNPVGRVWRRAELERLLALCARYSVTIFCDEIHSDIVFSGSAFTPMLALPGAGQRVAVGASPGKTFNISGLKTSFAIAPNPALRQRLFAVMDVFGTASCNLFGYEASIAAYTHGARWATEMAAYIEENHRVAAAFFAAHMPKLRAAPMQGTFLMWLDFSAYGLPQPQLMAKLREQAGVVLNDGAEFGPGGQGHARMNLGCSRDTLRRALEQISEAFEP